MSTTPPTTRRTSLPVMAEGRQEEGGGDSRVIRFIASTTGVARDGGIVESWDLSHYSVNPVVLWSHNPSVPPIAKALRAEMTARGLEIDAEFAGAGETQEHRLADIVFKLYKTGFLRSVSVGFRVASERPPTEEERSKGARWVCKGELLELSAVAVPADPGAVAVDRDLISRTFTTADVAVVRTQLGSIEPWQPILTKLESALAPEAVREAPTEPAAPLPPPQPETRQEGDHAACLEVRDLLLRCIDLLEDLHSERSEHEVKETRAAPQEAARSVVEVVDVKASVAPSDDRNQRLLQIIKKHYPHVR